MYFRNTVFYIMVFYPYYNYVIEKLLSLYNAIKRLLRLSFHPHSEPAYSAG